MLIAQVKLETHFFTIEAFGSIEGLNEGGSVAYEESIAGSSGHHANDGNPSLADAGRRKASVTNGEHMGHGLE